MRHWAAASLLTVSAIAFGAEPVTLELEPWPAQRECEACVVLQFRTLEMRIPLTEMERIISVAKGWHFVPPSGRVGDSLTLIEALPPEKAKLRVANDEQFFDRLGQAPESNKYVGIFRRAYNIESAIRYTKASKNGLHVYWIRASDRQWDAVYFVTEGSNTTYMLGGPITPEFYQALLANLRVTKIP